MSSQKAKRLCPELIFVPGRMNVYKAVSRQIHDIFHTYTDTVSYTHLNEPKCVIHVSARAGIIMRTATPAKAAVFNAIRIGSVGNK